MGEFDAYYWIHNEQAPKIAKMELGEILIYYLNRRSNGTDKTNIGPSNLINILTNDRLEELGIDIEQLANIPDEEIRAMALNNPPFI